MDEKRPLVDGEFIAKAASTVILAGDMADSFRKESQLETRRKSQGNFVTQADVTVEDYLKERLGRLDTQIGFVAEESNPGDIRKGFWAIDPIDGTGNYLVGLPYTISVALVDSGVTTLAMVFDPQQDDLWWAVRGRGAHRLGNASSVDLSAYSSLVYHSEPVVMVSSPADEGNVLFGMPYDRTKAHRILSYVDTLFENASDIKRIGPASLDICRVAVGQAKLYLELDLKVWDYAAGELILEEAGGKSIHLGDLSLFGDEDSVDWARTVLDTRSK